MHNRPIPFRHLFQLGYGEPPVDLIPMPPMLSVAFARRVLRGAAVGAQLAAGPDNWCKLRRAFAFARVLSGVAIVASAVLYLMLQS